MKQPSDIKKSTCIEIEPIYGLKTGELRFLRIKEVCAILSISKQQLHRLRKKGAFIRHIRLSSNVVVFRSDELLTWMNNLAVVECG